MALAATSPSFAADLRPPHRAVAIWLFVLAGMVFAMVVLGGATRLTESGLSIVEWKPFLGWIPPMSDAAWQELFDKYKAYPQYQKIFPNLTLAGFKEIFWLEYLHRVWGRVIGIAFLLPFLWFLIRGRLSRAMVPHLVVLFLLGAAQGALGWYMVASGLVERPSVSQYRLAAHLGLAFAIYVYLVWFALGLVSPRVQKGEAGGVGGWTVVTSILVTLTVVAGAFVAGLDAGLIYNSFPWMGEGLIPSDYVVPDKGFLGSLFESRAAVQFNHRALAIVTAAVVVATWIAARRSRVPAGVKWAASLLLLAVLLQVALGIWTLLAFVPVSLGTLHQAGALVVVTATIWLAHRCRSARPRTDFGAPPIRA